MSHGGRQKVASGLRLTFFSLFFFFWMLRACVMKVSLVPGIYDTHQTKITVQFLCTGVSERAEKGFLESLLPCQYKIYFFFSSLSLKDESRSALYAVYESVFIFCSLVFSVCVCVQETSRTLHAHCRVDASIQVYALTLYRCLSQVCNIIQKT